MGSRVAVWWKANRAYAVLAVAVGVACVAFAVVVAFGLPNQDAATAIDDIGEAVAAYAAMAAAIYAMTQTRDRIRVAWILLAISAGCWAAGETVWSVYEVGLGQDVPFPGWPDVGFVASIPFAFAGIRAFWREPRGTATQARVWLDGAIVAIALTFTAWALGLHAVALQETSLLEHILNVVYPIGDILVGTVLVLALRRATRRRAARMFVLLAGVGAYTLADSAFTYLNANGVYGVAGHVLDTGWFAGYLLIALAAMWPRNAVAVAADTSPVDLWQLALPWLAVLATGISALGFVLSGHELDGVLTFLVGAEIVLLTASMILTNRDFLGMLLQTRASEATLADVIKQAPVGIARADVHRRVIGANPALAALLGRAPDSILGTTLDDYIAPEARTEMAGLLGVAADSARAASGEVPLVRADGSKVWARFTTTAVKNAEGQTDYLLTTVEDVDARHQAEEAAKASLATLERLSSLKSEFLQSVSHEFKTALIGIQGFSEFMRDADQLDVTDVRAFAADIHRDAERLDRMVTEMLALDDVESNRANLRLGDVDINSLIEHEVAGAQVGTSATIVTALDAASPRVQGDEEKLSEAVRTLLANASRYSPERGRICVSTNLSGHTLTITVADEGVAARADFDNRLFGQDDLYANNPIRKVVGTGLGLGIVRQVVEMHGGRVWTDSIEGKGFEFHFTLPVAEAAAASDKNGGMVA
jgi:PAS domain S-box-containing protein